MSLTPRREQFVLHYFEHGNACEAYREAYSTKNMKQATIENNAYKLLQINEVATRLQELQGQAQKAVQYGVEEAFRDYQELQRKATKAGDLTNAVRCQKYIVELLGVEAPKKQDLTTKGEKIQQPPVNIPVKIEIDAGEEDETD